MAKLHLAQEILNIIYPVGSIYLSWNATNPSTLFGGTWERVNGGFLYGSTVSTGSTGNGTGTNTASTALTIDQMPSHKHPFRAVKERQDQITGGEHASDLPVASRTNGDNIGWSNFANDTAVGSSGGGKGHTHKIPYISVIIWRRTK